MGLFSNNLKIQETVDKSTKVFIVTYPYKGGKSLLIGMDILKNILKNKN
jgi:hypothetical protein